MKETYTIGFKPKDNKESVLSEEIVADFIKMTNENLTSIPSIDGSVGTQETILAQIDWLRSNLIKLITTNLPRTRSTMNKGETYTEAECEAYNQYKVDLLANLE